MATWRRALQSLGQPYRVSLPMVVLLLLVPLYVFLPGLIPPPVRYAPAVRFDHLVPLRPEWAIVYGALYLFLIVLPVLAVRDESHIRRTVFAYLAVWITAYVAFIAYPTIAPRPEVAEGTGFGVWGLRMLYGADPPYNCFPSLHVAHSFVSAMSLHRVNKAVGGAAMLAALAVGASTLFTKQHYVLDVLGGMLLAGVAGLVFLRPGERTAQSEIDGQLAPKLALLLAGCIALGVGVFWAAYRFDAR